MLRKLGGLILGVVAAVMLAQAAPGDSIQVPVIFYDFHSDGSNPEFECAHQPGLRPDMVAATLDAGYKPQIGTTPYLNYYMAAWFQPWGGTSHTGGRGDFSIPVYTRTDADTAHNTAEIRYDGTRTVNYDTAFRNVVMPDSLRFIRDPITNEYIFDDSAFFPLDNRGFGNEGKSHNYSFSMSMRWQFTFHVGQRYKLVGNDLWAFINGRKVVDLGGFHGGSGTQLTLDDTTAARLGLIEGNTYNFDCFLAQRHSESSRFSFASYPARPVPTIIRLIVDENVILRAGETVDIHASIFEDNVLSRTDLFKNITWMPLAQSSQPGDSICVSFCVPMRGKNGTRINADFTDLHGSEMFRFKRIWEVPFL